MAEANETPKPDEMSNAGDKKKTFHRNENWRGAKSRGHGDFRRKTWKPIPTRTEQLIRESMLAREDKPLIFDLSSGRSKLELNDW